MLELDEVVLGTPAYLAPERLGESSQVVPASDVYSLGVLLYKLLAGRLPWSAATTTQLLTDHVFTEPEPLPPIDGVPDEIADLCRAAAMDLTRKQLTRDRAVWDVRLPEGRGRIEAEIVDGKVQRLGFS
jgi:serine/threonine protein kinase